MKSLNFKAKIEINIYDKLIRNEQNQNILHIPYEFNEKHFDCK